MEKKSKSLQEKENEIWKDVYNEIMIEFKGKNALLYLRGKYIDTVPIEDIFVLKNVWQI